MPEDTVGFHVLAKVLTKALNTECWDPVLPKLYR